jgi:undecaprenyl-phosphate 4-deoxy-4-formamido-L-arabinose transferase
MASSGGDWIVTLDEDGQHDPARIPDFLDTALREQAQIVYGLPTNAPPHGLIRNTASVGAKWVVRHWMKDTNALNFQSFRLVLGQVGRSVAAYAGNGIYLDVALTWVAARTAQCPVELRREGERPSGYSRRRLLSHFWRLVLSSGTRGLRLVSILGVSFALLGLVIAAYVVVATVTGNPTERGWASLVVLLCVGVGATLFSLGVVAEYVGIAVSMAMGRPLYLITDDPALGPLGWRPAVDGQDQRWLAPGRADEV